MNKHDNTDYLLANTVEPNDEVIIASIAWLKEQGGGCFLTESRQTLENIFNCTKRSDFEYVKTELEKCGITLSWQRHGLPCPVSNILAVYVSTKFDDTIRNSKARHILIIPWTEKEANWFRSAYKPTIVGIRADNSIAPVDLQPEPQSVKGLIPDDQDKILVKLASCAAGYDNSLQWREIERFKAELMKNIISWIGIDPELVWLRCGELGMSADDAYEISNMIKQLREGHRFRPKKEYTEGWE